MARVLIPESLARLFPGAPRKLSAAGESVLDCIDVLNREWPGMRDRLLDGTPAIRRHIVIFVNGQRARLDDPVGPDDEILVMPAMSGG
jgi:hypothetical protein